MEVDGGLFPPLLSLQDLNGAQISAGLEQMSGEAMAQGVGMDGTIKARALRGFLGGVVYRFCVDRVIRSMPTVAGKEPVAGFSPQPTPVLAQLFKQLGAEHDVAVFAALSSADMNHHALAVDIAGLQVCYLSTPQAGSVECHEQSAMEGSASGIDEPCDFFLAEDRWKVMVLFRIRSLGDTPGFLERVEVEKAQSPPAVRNATRR